MSKLKALAFDEYKVAAKATMNEDRRTLSEEEIIDQYYPYWSEQMIKKYGIEMLKKIGMWKTVLMILLLFTGQ